MVHAARLLVELLEAICCRFLEPSDGINARI